MKRLFITAITVLTMSMAANAANDRNPAFQISMNVNKLSEYLMLDQEQREQVTEIQDLFSQRMMWAGKSKKKQPEKVRNAVLTNMKLMKQTLTPKQYNRYLTVLNMTLRNRGLTTIIDNCEK